MIVYRLEDGDGYGVWSGEQNDGLLSWNDGVYTQGCTLDRLELQKFTNYRFATDSIKKLKAYFGGDYNGLVKEKYKVVKYKVRKNYIIYGTGEHELAFKFDKGELICQ